MPRSRCHIDAPPKRVFAVLSDPGAYAYWVVGSRRIRDADPDWPEVGSAFHHAVGVGPLRVTDHTVVEAANPPRMLRLKAKARPLGTARVTLELRRRGRGTVVTMTEGPGDMLTALVFGPLTRLLVRRRNDWSLERLKELAEGRVEMDDTDRPSRWDVRRRRPAADDDQ
ncbi:MAG: hypothetical protein QOD61_537 [Solirubrobacteraceae bacterium]|nr:hypothetical protein [Solirubrobacteraceae bacterium]